MRTTSLRFDAETRFVPGLILVCRMTTMGDMDRVTCSPDRPRAHRSADRGWRRVAPVAILLLSVLALAACSSSEDTTDFADLTAGVRVYDQTGDSLDDAEVRGIQDQLDTLQAETGADVIAYVRELDADPDETLEQAEALQQAWVAAASIDQDTAAAILINREPGSDEDARAGIFVGTTFDDGNVPRSDQEDIVTEALIPPLREGDVFASLSDGIDRLGGSIRNGPPRTALNDFADGPGSSWLPWTGLALVLLVTATALGLHRRRAQSTTSRPDPTTRRPDDLSPGLAARLIGVGIGINIVQATILDLAARDALVISQEKTSKPGRPGSAAVTLLDERVARGEVERLVWRNLAEQAEGVVVDSDGLAKVAGATGGVRDLITRQADQHGWLNEAAGRARLWLFLLAAAAGVLLIAGIVVASNGSALMLVAVIPAAVATALVLVLASTFSSLSVAGLDAARPWEAYRAGLKQAGKDRSAAVDLDAVLTDVVAFNLGGVFKDRLEAATDGTSTAALRAFTPPAGRGFDATPAIFPWVAFSGSFGSSSGAVTSGGGAGGGGGAAGST